jgi:hypothetical protein
MEKSETKTTHPPETLYKEGYAAFEHGDHGKAIELAEKCLHSAAPDSYWYPGALALRCWAASWNGNTETAIRDAYVLLSMDSGDDKMWFDGTALLNIGLVRRRNGDNLEAEILFQLASERYAAYEIESDRPAEWPLIRDLFAAACHWAAQNKTDKLETLSTTLKEHSGGKGDVVHIRQAVELFLRAAVDEDIRADAESAISKGVSRTFLAVLLI